MQWAFFGVRKHADNGLLDTSAWKEGHLGLMGLLRS